MVTRSDVIDFLVKTGDTEYAVITETVERCREFAKGLNGAPKKRGPKPGSKRKVKGKPNGAEPYPIGYCGLHETMMHKYGDEWKCGKCAQEGEK